MINKVGIKTCPSYFAPQVTRCLGKSSFSGRMWAAARLQWVEEEWEVLGPGSNTISTPEISSIVK